jgi:acyl-CoA synthetase (AMP-forming)/AMP-acid ligase II
MAETAAKARHSDIGYRPGKVARNNVISYVGEHLENFPDRVAIRWVERDVSAAFDGDHTKPFPTGEITYGQLEQLIFQAAKGLQDLGIREGDRVIIFLPMGVGLYACMFAVQTLGAIAVFLDSWARAKHLGASAECVAPKAMISFKQAFELIEGVPGFESLEVRVIAGDTGGVEFDARVEELVFTQGRAEICPVESEHTALITFTTGSSGKPKGANRTHRFLSAQHGALKQVIPYTPDDIDLPAFPIFSLNNLASGVTTIIPAVNLAQPSPKDPAALTCQIVHGGITCATLSPSMLVGVAAYCAEKGEALPGLRRVVTGGAPISKDNVRDFRAIAPNAEVWVLYGSTEVEPMAHIEAGEMLGLESDPDPEIVEEGVNVGHVDPSLDYKFIKIVRGPVDLNERSWDELEVPRGGVGEFIVTGDHVCRDYYNNPEAFRKSKIRGLDGRVWHRTGDLARLDEQGYLWMVGRIHNVIERGDRYCFPVRAEVILHAIDGVKRGAFLGMPDDELGERTAVAIQRAEGAPAEAAMCAEVLRRFAKNDIPVDALYFVDDIPMDPRHHSKVEYGALRQRILDEGVEDRLAGVGGGE